ncbi:MAG: TerB family tellurite resistance protein [Deltaproteobacteria bacterium]|nr:TerB family tellurite resistance protein [Deltaproteobacteria bacterium]
MRNETDDYTYLADTHLQAPRPSALSCRQTKIVMCALLLQMAHSDGVLRESEVSQVLRSIQEKITRPPENSKDLYELANWLRQQPERIEEIAFHLSDSFLERERELFVALLLRVARADGFIHRLEKAYLDIALEHLGLTPMSVLRMREAVARGKI